MPEVQVKENDSPSIEVVNWTTSNDPIVLFESE